MQNGREGTHDKIIKPKTVLYFAKLTWQIQKNKKKILASGALADPSGAFCPNSTLRAADGKNADAFRASLQIWTK